MDGGGLLGVAAMNMSSDNPNPPIGPKPPNIGPMEPDPMVELSDQKSSNGGMVGMADMAGMEGMEGVEGMDGIEVMADIVEGRPVDWIPDLVLPLARAFHASLPCQMPSSAIQVFRQRGHDFSASGLCSSNSCKQVKPMR
jgi:hypothetical protein